MPDVEALVLAYLRDLDAVSALVGDRCYQKLPVGARPPRVLARRVRGRMRVRSDLDGANIQVEGLSTLDEEGGSRDEAHDVTAAARAGLLAMVGQFEMGTVTGVDEVVGPRYDPDPVTSWHRFLFEVVVFAAPAVLVVP